MKHLFSTKSLEEENNSYDITLSVQSMYSGYSLLSSASLLAGKCSLRLDLQPRARNASHAAIPSPPTPTLIQTPTQKLTPTPIQTPTPTPTRSGPCNYYISVLVTSGLTVFFVFFCFFLCFFYPYTEHSESLDVCG